MESPLPTLRLKTVASWEPIFASENKTFYSFPVDVHGVNIVFHTDNKTLVDELKAFFPESWHNKSQDPIHVTWLAPKDNLLGGEEWDNISDPDCFFHQNFICQRDFLAKKMSSKKFQLITPQKIDDGLFNFLRYLLPLDLLAQGKVLFHSSCVVNPRGEAYLFFGPSGAGKTTISSLCLPEGNVLGDDMNILSQRGGQIFIEGAAVGQRLYNKKNFGKQYPITKAFWLKQSPEFSHELFDGGEIKYFLSSFANLFWDQLDGSTYSKVFNFAGALKENLSLYQLNFKKEKEVWQYVQSI